MKIVLTGGPSGGKTTLCMALQNHFNKQVVVIPESATILFGGGFQRQNDTFGIYHQQRAIYHVQVEHEAIFQRNHPNQVLICDRGTIDGAAYWPKNLPTNFYEAVGTTPLKEADRYDWVLHLDTANEENYNNNHFKTRTENKSEADQVNRDVRKAWEHHPRRLIIPATTLFLYKVSAVLNALSGILKGHDAEVIQADICSAIEKSGNGYG